MTTHSAATSEPPPASAGADTAPRTLGRYELRHRVAQGGMASVWLASISAPEGFRKWVAVKTIHPHIATDARFVRMFLNEARLAAQIDHPNVCTVFDFGEAEGGTYFLAMEYLHGESLAALFDRTRDEPARVPAPIAARIVADAARGLHAAHELRTADGRPAEVVHRDVSPQNVFLLYSGLAKVVDFGIARSNEHVGERTATGEIKGKLAYMAPEQIDGFAVDRRADVWALGVLLWELTTGQRLFRRENETRTMVAVLRDAIARPSAVRAGYPAALEAVVMRALEREPSARYATAAEMARELEAFIAGSGASTTIDEVGEYARAVFADRLTAREQLLRADGGAEITVETPDASAGSFVRRADGAAAAVRARRASSPRALEGNTSAGTATVREAEPRRPRSRVATVSGALLLVASGAVGSIAVPRLFARAGGADTPASRAPVVAAVPAVVAPAPAPVPPLSREPAAPAPAPAPAARTPDDPPATPERPSRARAARSVAAAREPAGPPGYLNLISVPAASVTESGRALGSTPFVRRAMPSGRHVLRLREHETGRERAIAITVQPGQVTTRSVRW